MQMLRCPIQQISIHALREEGDEECNYKKWEVPGISIHALREEGDATASPMIYPCSVFLSTPSARRATSAPQQAPSYYGISIHALREEGDFAVSWRLLSFLLFLSTPSARRATFKERGGGKGNLFLSTPSARRATPASTRTETSPSNFYPRPPRGGRRNV